MNKEWAIIKYIYIMTCAYFTIKLMNANHLDHELNRERNGS